ncbi:MAG: hypothetical protein USCAAHI_01212 [Beijerinckiaceae bacterium]|jgi:hypothetical protein|nr:MAG: hypothetical protein USCAAHI_01212 [Beijerinckiaceae bacterium]
MGLSIILLDVTIAVLGLQWLGRIVDPGTYGLIATVAIVLIVVHLIRVLL